MNTNQQQKEFQRQSFFNANGILDAEKRFPDQVFSGDWGEFLFFQSDYLFSSEFIDAVHDALRNEQATIACLLNLDRLEIDDSGDAASIYIDAAMDGRSFRDSLVVGGPAQGWLFAVERYVCASNVGSWCVYCEKDSDIAVVAFRSLESGEIESCFRHVFAEPIAKLVGEDALPRIPFNNLVPTWREGLLRNYGICASNSTLNSANNDRAKR